MPADIDKEIGDFKDGDSVKVKKTGKETRVEGISTLRCPPIWCEDGHGYFAKELEHVEEAA